MNSVAFWDKSKIQVGASVWVYQRHTPEEPPEEYEILKALVFNLGPGKENIRTIQGENESIRTIWFASKSLFCAPDSAVMHCNKADIFALSEHECSEWEESVFFSKEDAYAEYKGYLEGQVEQQEEQLSVKARALDTLKAKLKEISCP